MPAAAWQPGQSNLSRGLASLPGWSAQSVHLYASCLQESASQSSKAAAAAQQHLTGSGSDDEDAAWEPMHSTAATADSQSVQGQAESVDSELMQVSSYVFLL